MIFQKIKIKIPISGGEDTVLGILEDLNKLEININRCIICAMPFCTGNTLSHVLEFENEWEVGGIKGFQRAL